MGQWEWWEWWWDDETGAKCCQHWCTTNWYVIMRWWINRRPLQNHNMLSKDVIVIGRDNENDEMMMEIMMRWWINRKPQHVIKRCHCHQPCKPSSAKMAENAKIAWKRTNCKQSNSNRRCTDLHKEPWALFILIIMIIGININILSWDRASVQAWIVAIIYQISILARTPNQVNQHLGCKRLKTFLTLARSVWEEKLNSLFSTARLLLD